MAQCAGKNKKGHRCLRSVYGADTYCNSHGNQDTSFANSILTMGAGALIGGALGSVVGGPMGGAVGAKVLSWMLAPDKPPASKKKVFVSFDFDNDQALKHLLVGQAQNPASKFEIFDSSLKEAAPEWNWQKKARAAIRRCDLVLVLVGRDTHRAPGVLEEIRIARDEGKLIVQFIGRSSRDYVRVPRAGKLLAWNRVNLQRLLSE